MRKRKEDAVRKKFKFFGKSWITVWLIVAALSFVAAIAYAAYTRVSVVKRVISTDAGVGARFSSDAMGASTQTVTRKGFPEQSDDPLVEVHVYNYPYPKSSLYRNAVTNYVLTAVIGTYDNSTGFTPLSNTMTPEQLAAISNQYTIRYKSGTTYEFRGATGGIVNISCSMAAGRVEPDSIQLHFDSAELSDTPPGYCIKLMATPEDQELPTLTGYVMAKYTKTADTGWKGYIETLESGKEYDAYNYIVEGSGKGRITIRWQYEKVSINQSILQNKDITFYIDGADTKGSSSLVESNLTPSGDYKSITLVVDSAKKNRYEIQFFKTNTTSYNYSNSDAVNYLPATTPSDWEDLGE